ncbi:MULTISPECIES: type VI secretion system tip protein TssI/VgrG [unclassified Caballeronia]|uniref:type VI secretion system Vgr family protein n=1 Tax=unclassified Caballeronia TaxID=2646786 RepID=UPI0028546B8C|nr:MULTISPECIES: type VI secretion system tip protein TssI/VgrG [unclassified Caballeronia]MDR5740389.1 type VI secretion system tip protein TssI/VgrG [Caballeronia sp. LZ016]MDR5808432.1 type VI secretion system tip protein TssI/VgrG [Caballeronia sp. LZ019]
MPIRLRGTDAIGELFEYVITLKASADYRGRTADIASLDLDKLLGVEATVFVQVRGKYEFIPGMPGNTGAGNVGGYTREISGIISTARIAGSDGRSIVYELTLRPALYLATQNLNSRGFYGLDVIEITREVMHDYPVEVVYRIGGPAGSGKGYYPKRDYQRQAFESDYSLLRRLWEEWGIIFWWEHSDGFHRLVLADGYGGYSEHGPAHATLTYNPSKARIDEEYIDTLSITNVLATGAVTLRDHDYTAPSWGRNGQKSSGMQGEYEHPRDVEHPRPEIYDWGNFVQPQEAGISHERNNPLEEARYLASVRMDSIRCRTHRGKGHGHLTGLLPGHTFKLKGYPQAKANDEYVVVSCTLDIQGIDIEAKDSPPFRCDTDSEIQPTNEYYRLEQKTPKPRIHGPEYAVVVGYKDAEQWLDAMGRALVQFRWDREGTFDEKRSVWLRVALPWQGNARGVAMPLRIGDEVIVSYINGDPDLAIIVGSVTNRNNVPAWDLPKNKALSGIRTRSLGNEQGTNHLALDDTKGELQAQLSSDQGSSILSLGFIRRIFGKAGRQEARGQGFELRTDMWGVLRAALGMLVTTEARTGAKGHAKDMAETVARLAQARQQHKDTAQLAQRHGAQETATQDDINAAIKEQNAAVKGGAQASEVGPEMTRPDLLLSSSAGIASTAADGTHFASVNGHAVTAGGDVSFSSGRSLLASVRGAISMFAYQLGIKLVAARGKVEIQALSNEASLSALKDITITSTDGKIVITASKEVWIGAGGSYIQINGSGIVNGSPGPILEKGASWDVPGADSQKRMPALNGVVGETPNFIEFNHAYDDLEPVKNAPYTVHFADGTTVTGKFDAQGFARLEGVPPGTARVEWGEDTRQWNAESKKPNSHLSAASDTESAIALVRNL